MSAGTTMTAAYTTFVPTVNNLPNPPAAAGIFYPVYVIAGSTLEDIYTEGLERIRDRAQRQYFDSERLDLGHQ